MNFLHRSVHEGPRTLPSPSPTLLPLPDDERDSAGAALSVAMRCVGLCFAGDLKRSVLSAKVQVERDPGPTTRLILKPIQTVPKSLK
jgi:hypothetical protein